MAENGTGPRGQTPFGSRMRAARKHAGLTQVQVCERLKIRQSTLSELETKASSSGYTPQLAALYGVHPVWLATGEGDMRGSKSVLNYGPSGQSGLTVAELSGASLTEPERELLAAFRGLDTEGSRLTALDIVGHLKSLPDDEQHELVVHVLARAEFYDRRVQEQMAKHKVKGFAAADRVAEHLSPAPKTPAQEAPAVPHPQRSAQGNRR